MNQFLIPHTTIEIIKFMISNYYPNINHYIEDFSYSRP